MSDHAAPGVDGYYRGMPAVAQQDPPPAHTGLSRRAATVLVLVVLGVLLVAAANLVQVPKVIFIPGPVYDTLGEEDGTPVVDVAGMDTYPTSGRLDFTTIRMQGGPGYPVTLWDWGAALLDPTLTVYDRELIFPEERTAEQVREQNLELMEQSQLGAAVVALRAAGTEVPELIKVGQVLVDAPAGDALQVNDEIVRVAGTDIATGDDVRDRLQDFEPGEEVPFTLVRDGQEQEVLVPTGESEVTLEDGSTEVRTVVGVILASDFDLPYDVTIDSGNVGGPSAGLMFALAVYDKITPGELTGGQEFAGTGAINSAGQVGAISGVKQKMVSAQRSGSDFFLAPASNCDDVRGNEPEDLVVIRVETFDQAREAVEQAAAGEVEGLPTCG